jgi:hypothetical protein
MGTGRCSVDVIVPASFAIAVKYGEIALFSVNLSKSNMQLYCKKRILVSILSS